LPPLAFVAIHLQQSTSHILDLLHQASKETISLDSPQMHLGQLLSGQLPPHTEEL